MSPACFILLAAVIGYVLGSISFAVMVAKRRGVNIFQAGSGNPGATNVLRVLGKGPGYFVFFLDFLKGFFAAHWPMFARHCGWLVVDEETFLWMGIAGLAGAVLGHSFSMFLRFRGGKGVATTIGGLMALMPWVTLGALLVWNAVFFASRYVSLASIMFGLALMPLAGLLHEPRELMGLSFVLAVLILWRHRGNLRRLMEGTEHKFGRKGNGQRDRGTERQRDKGAEE
jgi:glycerol-3-phosphate acyltransferase PlsY